MVDERTPRPDGGDNFFPVSPTLEGSTVVFNQGALCASCPSPDSIWAADLVTGALTKLVDTTTLAPGRGVKWGFFEARPVLKKGIVLFLADDVNNNPGLYIVPATGGPASKLVDTTTPIPGASVTFTAFTRGGFFHDGTTAVFAAQGQGLAGVYSIRLDGSSLARVADTNTPVNSDKCDVFPVGNFAVPTISNGLISFFGNTVFDASNGYNALYLGALAKTVNPGCTPFPSIVNSLQKLPGDPTSAFHTRYRYGLLDGQTLYYQADDANSTFGGIFSAPAVASAVGSVSTKLVDVNTPLPDYGPVPFVNNFTFVADQGNVIFHAYDPTYKKDSLYLTRAGGAISHIIGVGDTLDGFGVIDVQPPTPGAMSVTDLAFVWTRSDFYRQLEVTRMVSPAVTVTGVANAASYQSDSVSPGEIVAIFGTSLGPSNLGAANSVAATLDPDGTVSRQLSGARVLFNGIPAPLVYVGAVNGTVASAIVPFGVASTTSVSVTAEYQGNLSAPFTMKVSPVTPGLFSADSSGRGPGAIRNQDSSVNSLSNPAPAGSVITLFGTGVGQTNPPGVDGQVASLTPPKPAAPISVTVGGIAVLPADIIYQGDAPLEVEGLYQMNIRIPAGVPSGAAPVVLTVGTATSRPDFTVFVK